MKHSPRFLRWSAGLMIGALIFLTSSASFADNVPSKRYPQLQKIDDLLLQGKWKAGDKAARRLADQTTRKSWFDPDLRDVMTDLAFFRAVSSANLGEKDAAVLYWHIALNLDARRARSRDLGDYGDAAKLLLEFPLRRKGEVPPGYRTVKPPYRKGFERPKIENTDRTVLENTGAWYEKPPDFHVEVIVDEEGRLRHPIALSPTHPVLMYATLERYLFETRGEPASMDGEPVAVLFQVTMRFYRSGR